MPDENLRGSEKQRERWLREYGYERWTPAYYDLSEGEREMLQIGGIDPQEELADALGELPGEILLAYCKDYPHYFEGRMPVDADDAKEVVDELAQFMALELYEADFIPLSEDNFSVPLDHLTCKVRALLELWSRENGWEFYEAEGLHKPQVNKPI